MWSRRNGEDEAEEIVERSWRDLKIDGEPCKRLHDFRFVRRH
jgi:hypothetical protein